MAIDWRVVEASLSGMRHVLSLSGPHSILPDKLVICTILLNLARSIKGCVLAADSGSLSLRI